MAILFVPLNPPSISNEKGHYFSRVRTFWDILYDSGLIIEKIEDLMKADEQVFIGNKTNLGGLEYGISDLVSLVETDSNKIKPTKEDVEKILSIVRTYKPKIVCLMHNKVRKAFSKENIITKVVDYGNVGMYFDSIFFSVPFPTGSKYTKEQITRHYKELKKLLEMVYMK